MASEFDLTPSPEHRARRTPVRNLSAKRASPSPSPSGTRARAASSGLPPSQRGRRQAPTEVWPDASEAVHQRVACDPHAVATDDCARQLEADRRHMLVLKLAVESLHSRLLAHEEKAKVQATIIEEQKELHFGAARGSAKLKGDCKTMQTGLQNDTNELRAFIDDSFKAFVPNMQEYIKPIIVGATAEVIEARVELITRDLGKVMHVVGVHEAREKEMADYLEHVVAPAVGERPAEGRYVVHALEHFESSMGVLREQVGSRCCKDRQGQVA